MDLVLDFLLITGILFTGLLLIFLIRKQRKESPQKILIWIFVSILLVFISYYAYLHRIRLLFFATFVFSDSIDVFIGPLLWVYVKGIIGDTKNSFKDNSVHFVFPVLYVIGISFPALIGMASESYGMEYIDKLQPILLFTIVYSYVYVIVTYLKLMRFQKLVKLNYSNLENRDLNWVRYLLLATIVILTIDISTSIYETFAGDMGFNIGFISVIPIVFMVLYLGYYGTIQSKVLLPNFLFDTIDNGKNKGNGSSYLASKKYNYDQKEMQGLTEKLNDLMAIKKPFLEEDLTLSTLAQFLQVPDKKLSTLLNQNMGVSFYDYINRLRIEEVKRRMALPESNKYTLLAIAYDCGFKSKSSFNRIFKSSTQLSPSDYRKQLIPSDK